MLLLCAFIGHLQYLIQSNARGTGNIFVIKVNTNSFITFLGRIFHFQLIISTVDQKSIAKEQIIPNIPQLNDNVQFCLDGQIYVDRTFFL